MQTVMFRDKQQVLEVGVFSDSGFKYDPQGNDLRVDENGVKVRYPWIGVIVGPKEAPLEQYYVSLEYGRVWRVKPTEDQSKQGDMFAGLPKLKGSGGEPYTGANQDPRQSQLTELHDPREIQKVASFVSCISAFVQVMNLEETRGWIENGQINSFIREKMREKGVGTIPIFGKDVMGIKENGDIFIRQTLEKMTNMTAEELEKCSAMIATIVGKNSGPDLPPPKQL